MFTDRDLGKRLPARLRDEGFRVRSYFEVYPGRDAVPDHEWIAEAARRAWILLTHDNRIRRDPVALAALARANGRLIILRGSVPHAQLAELFLRAETLLDRRLATSEAPFIVTVKRRSSKTGYRPATELSAGREELLRRSTP